MDKLLIKAISSFFLAFIVFNYSSIGQDVNYTLKDGLPSNTVYCIEQDDDGFIWIGTAAGLSRYDGYEFINYGLSDGLPDTDILKFFKDSKGRIWLYTFNGKAGFIERGKIYSSKNSPYLLKLDFDTRISGICEFEEDIILSSHNQGVKILHNDSSSHSYDSAGWYHESQSTLDGWYLILANINHVFLRKAIKTSAFVELFPEPIRGSEIHDSSLPIRYTLSKGDLIIGSTHTHRFQLLFTIDTKAHEFKYLRVDTFQIYNLVEVDGQILLMTNEGIKKFDERNFQITHYLDLPEATDILIDSEGNQWTTSLHSGVHLSFRSELDRLCVNEGVNSVERFLARDSMLLMIINEDEVGGISNYRNEISNSPKLSFTNLWKIPTKGQVKGFSETKSNDIWILLTSGLVRNKTLKEGKFHKGGRRNLLKGNTILYSGTPDSLEVIDLNYGTIANVEKEDPPNIQDFIWISTNELLIINNETLEVLNVSDGSNESLSSFNGLIANKVLKDKYDRLWISTKGYGLFRIHQDSLSLYSTAQILTKRIEETSEVINSLYINESTLYITTPWGIELIEFSEFLNEKPVKINFAKWKESRQNQ